MKKLILICSVVFFGCNSTEKKEEQQVQNSIFTEVEINTVYEDSISIRAIEIMGKNVAFAANKGIYGLYNAATNQTNINQQKYDTLVPEFRAVASTENDFFMLSVGSPALLYKTGNDGNMELVYKEENEKTFYDSMIFWNEKEGIAMGDPTKDCLSIIITRDGGRNWEKLSCDILPKTVKGEAAFAASDSNIAVVGENTWIISGGMKSRVFYSPDKGKTWKVFETPLVQGKATTGGYSIAFYDENQGIVFGGDYTNPEANRANKAITTNGGKTWKLVGVGENPGYKSSVRYVPNSGGKEIVAVGFTGISYSSDSGESWKELSEEGFYTLRFLNDSVAYAAGKNKLARLVFK